MLNIQTNKLRFYEDTILYLQTPYTNFDKSKLKIEFLSESEIILLTNEDLSKNNFKILYSYSLDKLIYAEFVEDLIIPNDILNQTIYIAILFKKKTIDDTHKPLTFNQTQNINTVQRFLEISTISYDNEKLDLYDETIIKFETIYQLINKYPKFNFYDNQTITIKRWLDTLFATSGMGGFICIYFRTNPVDSETNQTFRNHVIRNVVAVKKLIIQNADGEFPEDKMQVSEWDLALMDDYVVHINSERFEIAFGPKQVPHERDYLYIPILNKLFQVNQSNPKRGVFGQIGWWETYLGKWEDNDAVTYSDTLRASLELVPDFGAAIDAMNDIELDDTEASEIFNEFDTIKLDTVDTNEKNLTNTIEEKKSATQNYSNTLVDSNNYVSLKETEKLREYFEKRLQLVSINPSTSAFPIIMYDNSTVDKNAIAIQYDLSDFTTNNKFIITVNKGFLLSLNFVPINKFNGKIISLQTNNLPIFILNQTRDLTLTITDTINNQLIPISYEFELLEFYNIELTYIKDSKLFLLKIYKLVNDEKNLDFENTYILSELINTFDINKVQLFGGKFYSSEITLDIDNKQILKDFNKPLLIMNNT